MKPTRAKTCGLFVGKPDKFSASRYLADPLTKTFAQFAEKSADFQQTDSKLILARKNVLALFAEKPAGFSAGGFQIDPRSQKREDFFVEPLL